MQASAAFVAYSLVKLSVFAAWTGRGSIARGPFVSRWYARGNRGESCTRIASTRRRSNTPDAPVPTSRTKRKGARIASRGDAKRSAVAKARLKRAFSRRHSPQRRHNRNLPELYTAPLREHGSTRGSHSQHGERFAISWRTSPAQIGHSCTCVRCRVERRIMNGEA